MQQNVQTLTETCRQTSVRDNTTNRIDGRLSPQGKDGHSSTKTVSNLNRKILKLSVLSLLILLIGCSRDRLLDTGKVYGNDDGKFNGLIASIGEHGGIAFLIHNDSIRGGVGSVEFREYKTVSAVSSSGVIVIIFESRTGGYEEESFKLIDKDGVKYVEWLGSDEGEGPTLIKLVNSP